MTDTINLLNLKERNLFFDSQVNQASISALTKDIKLTVIDGII